MVSFSKIFVIPRDFKNRNINIKSSHSSLCLRSRNAKYNITFHQVNFVCVQSLGNLILHQEISLTPPMWNSPGFWQELSMALVSKWIQAFEGSWTLCAWVIKWILLKEGYTLVTWRNQGEWTTFQNLHDNLEN